MNNCFIRKIVFILCIVFTTAFVLKNTTYTFPNLIFFPRIVNSNTFTNEKIKLGRYLFYDSTLSYNNTISCASCHKQQYAFSDSPNAFSVGVNNTKTKRNSMPLFNLMWSNAMFWDGRVKTVEEQVSHPLFNKNEMNTTWKELINKMNANKMYSELFKKAFNSTHIDSSKIVISLSQFVKTLISHQSKYDNVLYHKDKFTKDEYEGYLLLNNQTRGNCLHCHTTDGDVLGTTFKFSNNGLDAVDDVNNFIDKGRGEITQNKFDNGKFKIPSLRNLLFTAPYMHDGRFRTLEEVINFYSDGLHKSPTIDNKMEFVQAGGSKFSPREKQYIIAFLRTMSDSIFIKSNNYSNPFNTKFVKE
ncbi:MAG: cytochrome c peroxidase [Bacteroidia bacterium]